MKLKTYYNSLKWHDRDQFRSKVIENCGITYAIWWHWLNQITGVPLLAQKEINRIAKTEIKFNKYGK